jgi:L-alanine-DL-glutamate epimerase-like enolase superfamily enzyme
VKVRVGFGLEVDEDNLTLVRRLMGKDVVLFADANQAWSLREALMAADMLARYDVRWIEEPIKGNRVEELEELYHKTGLEVATGENVYGVKRFLSYATSLGVGVLQPDVSKTGGITETVPICDLAAAANKSVAPRFYGGAIAQAATLQLAACLQQVDYVEFKCGKTRCAMIYLSVLYGHKVGVWRSPSMRD